MNTLVSHRKGSQLDHSIFSNGVYFILRILAIISFKLFFRISASGVKNIPKRSGFILASNHASFLDPIAIGIASPRVLNYLARDDLFENKFFNWLLTNINVFPLKRNSADLGALRGALRRLREGGGLVLFPEGTRTADGAVNKFYEGAGFLALKSNVPIVPIFIKGSSAALPKGARCIKPKKIQVFFGEKIEPRESLGATDKEIYGKITEKVLEAIKDLGSN